jgi:sialic acid synthase SpsE
MILQKKEKPIPSMQNLPKSAAEIKVFGTKTPKHICSQMRRKFNTNNVIPFHAGKSVFNPQTPLIIAELGTSHGGNRQKAKDLIDAAAYSGANCVKFQIVYADEILHPNTGEVPLPGGNIRLFDRFKELEVPADFFAEMKDYAENRGLIFLCTPFGIKSAQELHALNPGIIKIASPELNYTKLLEEVSSYKMPVILSSGVSALADIEDALRYFDKNDVCLLHCITSYPAPESEYNLRLLQTLSAVFGVSVGLSDHSLDPILVPALAIIMGASVIEKHFCLSRNDPGLDDPIALNPDDFAKMVKALRHISEIGSELALSEMIHQYGEQIVSSILGNGVKKLAASEQANYERTRRSVHALRNIVKGEIIQTDMIASLRTEKKLKVGLHPKWEDKIVGKKAQRDIPSGEGITIDDI